MIQKQKKKVVLLKYIILIKKEHNFIIAKLVSVKKTMKYGLIIL